MLPLALFHVLTVVRKKIRSILKTHVVGYFKSFQIVTSPVKINQRKMTPPIYNKLENSDSPN